MGDDVEAGAVSDDGRDRMAEEYFHIYADYAKTARAWLVGFGIGGPVLFLTQSDVSEELTNSKLGFWITLLFLIGIATQVGITLLNKWNNWFSYRDYLKNPEERDATPWAKRRERLSDRFWIDVVADIISVGAFLVATVMLLTVFF